MYIINVLLLASCDTHLPASRSGDGGRRALRQVPETSNRHSHTLRPGPACPPGLQDFLPTHKLRSAVFPKHPQPQDEGVGDEVGSG